MLDRQVIEAEIAKLSDIIENVRDLEIHGMVVLIRPALKWTLDGPEDEPPSGVLQTLTGREPYPLKPIQNHGQELNDH
jgi:hypothetical protein